MPLQLTLTLGQVEVQVGGSVKSLANSVLMHVDDINDVNRMIRVTNQNIYIYTVRYASLTIIYFHSTCRTLAIRR